MTVKDLNAYQVIREKKVNELNSDAVILEHKKTGAEYFCFPMMTRTRYSVLDSVLRRLTVPVCRTLWSTAFSAVPRNFR